MMCQYGENSLKSKGYFNKGIVRYLVLGGSTWIPEVQLRFTRVHMGLCVLRLLLFSFFLYPLSSLDVERGGSIWISDEVLLNSMPRYWKLLFHILNTT